jgi:hypothetical protein
MVSAKGFVHLPWKALLTWFGRLSFENHLQYRWRLLSTLSYASIDLAGNSSSNKYRGHKFKRCLSNDDSQIVESRLVCIPMKGRIQLLLLHISLQTFLVIMSSFDIRWICLFQIVSSTFDNIRPWFCFIQTLATAIVGVENMCYLWSKPFSFFRSSAIQRKLEFTLSFATMIWVACPLVPK